MVTLKEDEYGKSTDLSHARYNVTLPATGDDIRLDMPPVHGTWYME